MWKINNKDVERISTGALIALAWIHPNVATVMSTVGTERMRSVARTVSKFVVSTFVFYFFFLF